MLGRMRSTTKRIATKLGFDIVSNRDSVSAFHSFNYLRHTARRLEHLASLRIPVTGMSVLDVGAGIGDHSHYYIDRGCRVTITDARAENLKVLGSRYPSCRVGFLDMESPIEVEGSPFDLIHCYGLLYHLANPAEALAFLGRSARKFLFLETCVSFGEDLAVNITREPQGNPTQAFSGTGCRPTRAWLFRELQGLFEHVYVPKTQPCHEEFPLDWTFPDRHREPLQRAVFIASRERLENDLLAPCLVPTQTRHG